MLEPLGLKDPDSLLGVRRQPALENECCACAALRAAFLLTGYAADPHSEYRLEFSLREQTMADFVGNLLKSASFPAKGVGRRGQFVVYLNGMDAVGDALTFLGAPGAMLKLQSTGAVKNLSNAIHRQLNCDASNIVRALNASEKQVRAIEAIQNAVGLASLTPPLMELAQARLDNPNAPLSELGALLDPPLGKSSVNSRMRRLMDIAEKLSAAVQKKTKARSFVQQQSSFGGRRSRMPIQYVLQATNLEKLEKVLPKFMEKVYENPVFQMADVDLKFSKPEARIHINRDKANVMGVSTRDLSETLQYGLSGQRMGYFYMNGKQYEILGEINRQQRNKPADLRSIYLRSNDGKMIQMDNLIELENTIAPPKLYRYNRFVSATVSAGLAEGKTIGEGLDEMDKIAKEVLDDTFRTTLAGDSKDFRESSSSLMFAFILALVLIYLILAAQFESFKDPFIIMLTVPLAITGALIFMFFGDITMNVFSQIGIIMLIGLVAKNGILIVEFANQKQQEGQDKLTAVREASNLRLRPILMTSAATVLGLIPLAFASGEGCNQRIAMGVAVVGGMLVSTVLTMYIVPSVYSFISTNRIKKLTNGK